MDVTILDLFSNSWVQMLQEMEHDIYHLPEYVHLESQKTNTMPEGILISEGEQKFFVPYLIRKCDNLFEDNFDIPEIFDVVSPYGYPGILLSDKAASNLEFINLAIKQLKQVFSTKNICSAFFRLHPILNHNINKLLAIDNCKLQGETISINLELNEEEIWRQTRNDHRNKINWCKRAGMEAKIVLFKDYLQDFIAIYEETMNRVGANDSYYFDYDYFMRLSNLDDKIHLCIVEWQGQIACAGLFTECCGIVQFHLSGTKNQFLKQAPSKLMLDYVRYWGKKRGNKIFHLGGGVGSAKDSLYEFKAGFSKITQAFTTLRLITNEEKYRYLVELRAKSLNTEVEKLLKSDFFPAYRASEIA